MPSDLHEEKLLISEDEEGEDVSSGRRRWGRRAPGQKFWVARQLADSSRPAYVGPHTPVGGGNPPHPGTPTIAIEEERAIINDWNEEQAGISLLSQGSPEGLRSQARQ